MCRTLTHSSAIHSITMRIIARRPCPCQALHARAHVRCRSAHLSAPHPAFGEIESPWFLPRGFCQGDEQDPEPAVTLTKLGPEKWELANSETLVLGPEVDPGTRKLVEPFLKYFNRKDLADAGIKRVNSQWTITVPAKFFFDLGSIPRLARGIIGPQEMLRSSMVHDYLYNLINCAKVRNRKEAKSAIDELKRAADDVLEFALKCAHLTTVVLQEGSCMQLTRLPLCQSLMTPPMLLSGRQCNGR